MAKKTLVEKMESKCVPMSWINEVKALLRTIEEKDIKLEEYMGLIDVLARKVEVLEGAQSMSQLRRLKTQTGRITDE